MRSDTKVRVCCHTDTPMITSSQSGPLACQRIHIRTKGSVMRINHIGRDRKATIDVHDGYSERTQLPSQCWPSPSGRNAAGTTVHSACAAHSHHQTVCQPTERNNRERRSPELVRQFALDIPHMRPRRSGTANSGPARRSPCSTPAPRPVANQCAIGRSAYIPRDPGNCQPWRTAIRQALLRPRWTVEAPSTKTSSRAPT